MNKRAWFNVGIITILLVISAQMAQSIKPPSVGHLPPKPPVQVPENSNMLPKAPKRSKAPSDNEIRHEIVGLLNLDKHYICTGVQVKAPSGKLYILSAAHCAGGMKNPRMLARDEDKQVYQTKVLAVNMKTDLLLLEAIPGIKPMKVANHIYEYEHVRCFGHGAGHDTFQSSGEILEIEYNIARAGDVLQLTTADLVGGMSGGPAVNDKGEIIGINDAVDGAGFGYLVTLKDIVDFLKDR